ncbi:hypothetical protein ACH4FX_37440 [Streptomyces sp. NPDC018019]|uniref:hypothetical protein n=1 Tax=Streptomyces sp. NPDC018019 TaxID=3365030 RepID=UPI0037A72724
MTDRMPLSVPLFLVPGEPDHRYTVHVHRVRWEADAVTGPLTADHLAPLEAAAREGLRMVAECVAAELADADVEVTGYPDGSTAAVARVLCTEDACAAVAERYQRDAAEGAEAEAARKWAATQLRDQTVELLKLRGETEKPTPGKTAADLLAAVLAAQQERTGGQADRVVLWLDEAAHLFRDSGLFLDRSPEEVRQEIDRMIRRNRAPYPVEASGGAFGDTTGRGKTRFEPHRLTDFDTAPDLVSWAGPARNTTIPTPTAEGRAHLDLPNAFHLAPEPLVREAETLARSAAVGETRGVGVRRLAGLCAELARRHGAEPQPRPCPGGCTEDDDAAHDLVHRIGHRPRAVRAGEVRTAGLILAPERQVLTLPAALPDDDAALVLVYRADTPGLALLDAIRRGDEAAAQDAVTGLLHRLTADGK